MMHCKRFYIYTNNDNDHDSSINTDGLMRYTLSIDRSIHVTSLPSLDREMLSHRSNIIDKNEQLLGHHYY